MGRKCDEGGGGHIRRSIKQNLLPSMKICWGKFSCSSCIFVARFSCPLEKVNNKTVEKVLNYQFKYYLQLSAMEYSGP